VLVTMLVVGVFIPAVEVTNSAANTVRARLILDVYMKNTATASDEARVRNELLAVAHVKKVQFESKAQAYAQEARQNPAAYALLGGVNPLPDTFHVFPDNPGNVLGINRALTGGGGMIDPAIESVSNKKNYTKKALELTSAVKWGGLAFAALLTIASVLLIANTIRLSLYARRREVEVMKLVGATDWFIRWPFVIEGVIVGAAGGILAIGVLAVTKVALLDPLLSGWSLVSQIRTIAFPALIAVLLATSAAVSAVGSGLSLRRFLRV
jgi:cell division transport system permease protein